MRSVEEVCRRWTLLFDGSIGLDLRQTVQDDKGFDPCGDGLRSVCWKAFLLYGPLGQSSWPKKITESRAAYVSLRDYFLRFIENPDDIHSTTDPLADDENSPWSTLRQDEVNREEIFQDVIRCMQDNYFFREPTTQKRLLDILFIYSKLNPDIGYRQGMHELLAPILWVVHQDSIDTKSILGKDRSKPGIELMMDVLDQKYIEHDSFSLFCAVMQTVKVFYEPGSSGDSSPIVLRSRKIHEELLDAVDPELAIHLQVVGILPQIYMIRWLRLLFGREFDFAEVLRLWDVLFAEHARSDLIDFTCVALLLRMRWLLIEADYTTAITTLTHCELPPSSGTPRSLVKDALTLEANRNKTTGAQVIQQHSGRIPVGTPVASPPRPRPNFSQTRPVRTPNHQSSPNASPARFSSPQRQLESLFSEVSSGLQRRTEGWNVTKAVRGAVGEVTRNVASLRATHSRQPSQDVLGGGADFASMSQTSLTDTNMQELESRLQKLQERNKALAKMLDEALESLRSGKSKPKDNLDSSEDLNMSLAKIQFVSLYLSDPNIPIPEPNPTNSAQVVAQSESAPSKSSMDQSIKSDVAKSEPQPAKDESLPSLVVNQSPHDKVIDSEPESNPSAPKKHLTRPSLNDSSFSFMLGENRHRSSFVSSATPAPEHSRSSDGKPEITPLWKDSNKDTSRPRPKPSQGDSDGDFTLANWA